MILLNITISNKLISHGIFRLNIFGSMINLDYIKNDAIKLRERVDMPNTDFLVRVFSYEQKEAGGVFPLHWHENIEFIYVFGGSMVIECSGNAIEISAGDCIVINSNEYHGSSYASANLALYCVMVDMSVLNSRFFDACEEKYIYPVFHNMIIFKNLIPCNSQFQSYISKIMEEYNNKEKGFELAIKALLYNMIVFLLRNNVEKVLSARESLIRENNFEKINNILQYIDENYMDEIKIADISQKMGISKFYLCKLFKKMTGKTITEYVNYVRVREAVALIRETDISITDVALTVGFNDANYFSRIFHSFTNNSPSEIRKTSHQIQINKWHA